MFDYSLIGNVKILMVGVEIGSNYHPADSKSIP